MSPTALLGLMAFVMFGSVVPVVPTGAAVSAGVVVVSADHPWEIVLVIGIGALGAYLGDIATYGALRRWGEPLAQRVAALPLHAVQAEEACRRERAPDGLRRELKRAGVQALRHRLKH